MSVKFQHIIKLYKLEKYFWTYAIRMSVKCKIISETETLKPEAAHLCEMISANINLMLKGR